MVSEKSLSLFNLTTQADESWLSPDLDRNQQGVTDALCTLTQPMHVHTLRHASFLNFQEQGKEYTTPC